MYVCVYATRHAGFGGVLVYFLRQSHRGIYFRTYFFPTLLRRTNTSYSRRAVLMNDVIFLHTLRRIRTETMKKLKMLR